MTPLLTLAHREWLQHRFGWALLVLLPLALALLVAGAADIRIDAGSVELAGAALPTVAAAMVLLAATVGSFAIAWLLSMFIASGIARRDDADRSVEFWLSLPTSHSASLGVPLGVHLLLVPAAALLIGLASGLLLSMVVVTRLAGFQGWVDLPWALLLPAAWSVLGRLMLGLPLATLWLLPLLLLLVLARAWIGRWGTPVALLALGLGAAALGRMGLPQVQQALRDMLLNALAALTATPGHGLRIHNGEDVITAMASVPKLAWQGAGLAVQGLATPLFALALLLSAGLFALLVQWRQRGASRGL